MAHIKTNLQTTPPKLCRNCKYFVPSKISYSKEDKIKYGNCTYFQKIDLVTGHIEYTSASIVREYECQDVYYTEKERELEWWEKLIT